jgi:hypothetical protein
MTMTTTFTATATPDDNIEYVCNMPTGGTTIDFIYIDSYDVTTDTPNTEDLITGPSLGGPVTIGPFSFSGGENIFIGVQIQGNFTGNLNVSAYRSDGTLLGIGSTTVGTDGRGNMTASASFSAQLPN